MTLPNINGTQRRVLALFNARAGLRHNPLNLLHVLNEMWDRDDINFYYQESRNPDDCMAILNAERTLRGS